MVRSGSASVIAVNSLSACPYQNEWRAASAALNRGCKFALQETGKLTVPRPAINASLSLWAAVFPTAIAAVSSATKHSRCNARMSIGKRPAGLHFQDERISAIIVTSLGFRVGLRAHSPMG